jgi:hypothetical protein
MSRNREFARQVESAVNGVSGRVRHYADEAAGVGSDLLDRSRRITGKLGRNANDQRIRYLAEDLADEATYQYRKLRRRVQRHPGVTIGIAAAAIGTFLLIRHALRDDD